MCNMEPKSYGGQLQSKVDEYYFTHTNINRKGTFVILENGNLNATQIEFFNI